MGGLNKVTFIKQSCCSHPARVKPKVNIHHNIVEGCWSLLSRPSLSSASELFVGNIRDDSTQINTPQKVSLLSETSGNNLNEALLSLRFVFYFFGLVFLHQLN